MTLTAATTAGATTRGPVLEKIWLQHYPAGVPAEINPSEYRSLRELIEQSIAQHRDRPCFTCMDRTLTYGDLDVLASRFAAYLQQVARLRKGDRIALMLPNVLQYPVAILGAFRAGLTIVNTNPMYTPRELQHQLHDSGARAILILENFAHTLAEVQHDVHLDTVIVTGVGDLLAFPKSMLVNFVLRHVKKQVPEYSLPGAVSLTEALSKGRYENLERVELGHEDIAFLQYTGGTTGVSKGAVLTHRNLIANVLQSEAWIRPQLDPDQALIAITALPLYHIFALTANSLTMIKLGAHNILIPNPRDFAAFVQELARHRFSFFAGVNTLFNALLHTKGFDSLDFSGLRVSLGGGMAVQQAVAERWKEVTGNVLTQAWGLTETSPAACINRPGDDFNGSIGLPISSTIITIRDDDGNALPQGQSGEICVEGPQVMRCYWNRPDETEKVMLPGQVLRTGDIGYMDARGFVYIEDRKKDMILVSGFNVYPNEVEGVAVTHPGVLEVAAVAQPDERAGEVVALFVVRKDPAFSRAVSDGTSGRLEDEADVLARTAARPSSSSCVRSLPDEQRTAGGRFVEAREQGEQRRLAGAGRADDRDGFAAPDRQRHVRQNGQRSLGTANLLAEPFRCQHHRRVVHQSLLFARCHSCPVPRPARLRRGPCPPVRRMRRQPPPPSWSWATASARVTGYGSSRAGWPCCRPGCAPKGTVTASSTPVRAARPPAARWPGCPGPWPRTGRRSSSWNWAATTDCGASPSPTSAATSKPSSAVRSRQGRRSCWSA